MATIGKVRAVFTASTSGLVSGVNAAAASMRRLEGTVANLGYSFGTLVAIEAAEFFGELATTVTRYARSLANTLAAQAQVIDSQSKLAARTGMTYGEFAGLALAGDLAGVGMESIATAATKADIAFVKASKGSATARALFDELGLSIDDMAGMSAAQRFEAIAAAISELPTEAERAAAATAMFGRAGSQLLPLFAGGAEGIALASAQAERLGLALTTAQGQDVEAMNDAFTLAGKAIEGVVTQVVAYLAPAVQAVADTFTNLVGSIGGANIGQAIGDGILVGARYLAGIGDWLVANLSGVWQYVSEVGAQWNAVADFLQRGAAFLSGVFNSAQVALGSIVIAFSGVFEGLARIAQSIGGYLGFDTASLDSIVAGARAFNAELEAGITANANQAAADFATAFGSGQGNATGQAIAGPVTQALDAAIAQANASAAQVEEAGKGAASAVVEAAAVATPQQLKGTDSRSAEGVAEMFRLMRGESGDVQERQLGVLEQIRDELSAGDDSYPFAFEGG